ncbi:MAG: Leucine--tRNA ligase [Holosporales bacterium]
MCVEKQFLNTHNGYVFFFKNKLDWKGILCKGKDAMAYNFRLIESKWQDFWEKNKTFKVENVSQEKAYILEMLPYPSGNLHMGHVRNYAIGDAIARYKTMNGASVLHPMGWDAFGLPAENAAMERKAHPKQWTIDNIQTMKKQLKSLGLSYDWDREITSCLPEYYGHEQKIFIDFYKKGIAYKKESWVNWDPIEHTVLANEQVVDGKGWRSGAPVERKKLNQWSLKITDYAKELLDSLQNLKGWPEKVIKMQENWIGESKGALVQFDIHDIGTIDVFTTRPDTLFGASFLAISAHHPILEKIEKNQALSEFLKECDQGPTTEEALSTMEKKGFDTGLKAVHPFDDARTIPVYIANFVVADYGTGALFGCPAHDQRDFDFAQKYNLPILPVVETKDPLPYLGEGLVINSQFLDGFTTSKAKDVACEKLEERKKGKMQITYRLRDWLISRQRYWGCPIPFVHCPDCGMVPETNLPVCLPDDITFDKPGNPLDHHPTWKFTTCPECGKDAVRETDTFDTFFESSWYFLRYCSPTAQTPFEKDVVNTWAPVDWYIGGIEHAVLHLLYARFFIKALRDCGYLSFDEPFTNLLTQGMVCHETYKSEDGRWLYPYEVQKEKGVISEVASGQNVDVGPSIKMSKSKRNTVDPLDILASYGADVARLFVLSDTPPDKDFDWNEEGLDGCWRYANKLWRLIENLDLKEDCLASDQDLTLKKKMHQTLQKINDAFAQNTFNKVIAYHREFVRDVEDAYQAVSRCALQEVLEMVFKTIAPLMPHLAFEALEILNVTNRDWPVLDATLAQKDHVVVAIQVNGKLRATVSVGVDMDHDALKTMAYDKVASYISDAPLKKAIVVPNKIVNFVI